MHHEIAKVLNCPLCFSPGTHKLEVAHQRTFYQCSHCSLIFVPYSEHLSEADEKARYTFHNNNLLDSGYRAHLMTAIAPLLPLVPTNGRGLDFGSGPHTACSEIFKEYGFQVYNYDPYFAPNQEVLKQRYDFITCIEVAEHFRNPAGSFEELHLLLKPGGVLVLSTQIKPVSQRMADWWYARDKTHICFYSRQTFAYLAQKLEWEMVLASEVFVFRSEHRTDVGKA